MPFPKLVYAITALPAPTASKIQFFAGKERPFLYEALELSPKLEEGGDDGRRDDEWNELDPIAVVAAEAGPSAVVSTKDRLAPSTPAEAA